MSRLYRLLSLGALLLIVVLVATWAARRPLSEAVVARWFAAQKVEARYRISAISPGGVTLTGVSLGPAAHPEFTAERIEASVGWSPLRPRVESLRLFQPQLRATLGSAGLSFGSLDRLLPAPRKTAEALPDIDLQIVDGRLNVDTPAGKLNGRIDGSGRLPSGFDGLARLEPARLALTGCATDLPGALIRLISAPGTSRLSASGQFPAVHCKGGTVEAVSWTVIATLPSTLDRYDARLFATSGRATAAAHSARSLRLTVDASAPALDAPVAGHFAAQLATLTGRSVAALSASAGGSFAWNRRTAQSSLKADIALAGASPGIDFSRLSDTAKRAAGTLAKPILDQIVVRLRAAARSIDATASLTASRDADTQRASLSGLKARSASGAVLTQAGQLDYANGKLTLAGSLDLSGGGLPKARLSGSGDLRQGSARLSLARVTAPGAAVDVSDTNATWRDGIYTIDSGVRVSGGVGGGVVVRDLDVPLAVVLRDNGAIIVGTRCAALSWTSVARDTLHFGPGGARLCPKRSPVATLAAARLSGGAVIDRLSLRGAMSGTALAVGTAPIDLTLSGSTSRPVATLAPVPVNAAYGARQVAATLSGSFDLARFAGNGRIVAASLADPGSPVNIDHAEARWQFAGGRLTIGDGAARVTDRSLPARFEPLRLNAVAASLADGRIEAHGNGGLAATPARLFAFTAKHDIASGRGSAAVDTGVLSFGPALQPYQITENLRGIVDNVVGPVSGTGHFDWTATTLTSSGRLRIDKLALATAALGPVTGIDGTLEFDDLLKLTTPPGQRLKIAQINPGVAVDDGVVVFRMLSPDAAAIDSIRWPYAGGTLTLAPVTIRAGDLRRDFLLTVDDLDAQQFLQRFEIKNVSVTGRFDGRLPLVFADGKGRIVAGRLTARTGGGLLQYVGEIGGEDLGAGAKLAFDALRRLRYKELTLDLDGDLDGELVTQLRFAGTNETAATIGGGPLPIRATGLPFKFNVTIRAPFRALLGTASSFSDVRPLIRPAAADQVQPR